MSNRIHRILNSYLEGKTYGYKTKSLQERVLAKRELMQRKVLIAFVCKISSKPYHEMTFREFFKEYEKNPFAAVAWKIRNKIYPGLPGQIHDMLLINLLNKGVFDKQLEKELWEYGEGHPEAEAGWITKGGRFVNREEAKEYIKDTESEKNRENIRDEYLRILETAQEQGKKIPLEVRTQDKEYLLDQLEGYDRENQKTRKLL